MENTVIQQIANIYQEFFDFMNQEHDLILTVEEMDEILYEARKLEQKRKEGMTPVEYLAERYNYITWLRNRDEISRATADEWREKFLKEAKEMEDKQLSGNFG